MKNTYTGEVLNDGVLAARRRKHRENVRAAFEAASRGEVINLSALMVGAEQTGADMFGGDATVSNREPLASNNWKVR